MVKQEFPVFPLVPPGFEHLPPPNSATAVEPPRPAQRTPRKRNRSDIFDSPVRRPRTATPRRRASQYYTLQEAHKRGSNQVLSTPLTRPQGRMLHYEPVQLTNAQSSSQPINEATTIDRSVLVPRGEGSKNVGSKNKSIDLKMLKYIADALNYLNVSQTPAQFENVSSGFKRNIVHTLMAIDKRYGDITEDCLVASDCMRSFVLMGICKVVRDLEKKRLDDLADISSLDPYYTAVRDAEIMNVNVQWLHKRLDEIKDAVTSSTEAKRMLNERNARLVNIDRMKKEISLRRNVMESTQSEVEVMERWLGQEAVVVQELCKNVDDHMSRISQFQRNNLMDGVL